MGTPLFSVIIPTLNEEKYLPNLLDSLTKQTQKDFEAIVVDGKSKDKTCQKALEFKVKLPSLKVVEGAKRNVSHQRNFGAEKASGEWLVFADADSILMPYFFERLNNYLASHESALLTTWCKPDSEITGDAIISLLTNLYIESSIVVRRPLAPGPLTIVKKQVFDEVGGYDPEQKFGEDYDLTRRLVNRGINLDIIRETLYIFSLRRIRAEGKLKFIQTYAKATFIALLTKKGIKQMPGYLTGGQWYDKKNQPIKRSSLKNYELKFKKLMKELLG